METDGHFDDAFIEDSDQSNTILDHSSEAVTDKSLRRLNNSSIATKEKIAADRQAISHWPQRDLSSPNRSELSSEDFCTWEIAGTTPKSTEKNCIWEIAGVTPKSTEKAVRDSAKRAVLMDYCATAMSPSSLKGSPSTVSMVTKNCSVKVRDILLTYNSPTKKTDGFSSSPRSVGFGEIVSSNMLPQSQPLGAQNDIVTTDDCCRGKRRVNSFCGKKLLKARAGSVKKRPWKEKDVSRKRKCFDPSIAIVPPVSLKDSPSKILSDSKDGLTVDKSFLLTSMTLPSSSQAQHLHLNSPVDTNRDIDTTGYWVKNKRILGHVFEKKLLEESAKPVKKWTKNVASRKRKHMGRIADETFALGQPMSDIERCFVKFPLHSDETVCPSPAKNESICNKMVQTDVCDDVTSWAAPSTSDENLRLISGDIASSNNDADKQNCLWEMYSGEKLLFQQNSRTALAGKVTEPSGDENAVLANELKNWEPFSTDILNKTVGGIVEDTEMALQDTGASDANLARMQNVSSDQLTTQGKKKRGRRSMSADREIVSQMMEMICSEASDVSSTAFPYKRYPQRTRRRSTELLQFTQIEVFPDVAEEPVTVTKEGSTLEPGVSAAVNETEMHPVSESLANIDDKKLDFESTARSEDELTLDLDGSVLDSDFNLYPVPAKPSRRLRRKSTDLFRLTQNNQNQLSATFEEMLEEQESSPSQNAQNDTVNTESSGKQTGTNKPSRRTKQKKGKAEDGPPLEDIYLNRLWRSQMPKDTSWETIPEDPKYNKETGSLRVFSARKAKRFLDFDEGPSPSHLKKRKLKARKNGWKPLTKKKDTALSKLLTQKLLQLDGEIGAGE